MTDQARPSGAVFLSYAREDGEAARHIAEALRAFGVEVWFDMSELRGGDVWDAKIKKQIRECTLFLPIISANTQAREEGYFRREWKMAVDRTHDMAENRAFIVPVIVDDTREADANVPEQFLKAHCTRLPGGEPTPQFVEQVKRLLQPQRTVDAGAKSTHHAPPLASATPAKAGFPIVTIGLAVAVVALLAFVFLRPAAKVEPAAVPPPQVAATAATPAVAPPSSAEAKSIAVLPFVNMSTDADQGFFADGLAEELLNLLAKVPALQVTSRSSAFSYKGKEIKLEQVARELHVAHILEGSVRKSGNRLRITAQLIDARTDTHLWSETYDRSLNDIFAVQDEIAAAVVAQLKVALLGANLKTKTYDPKAYAFFLQGRQLVRLGSSGSLEQAVAIYQEALKIDPSVAGAYAGLAECYDLQASNSQRPTVEALQLAHAALQKGLEADPESAAVHSELGVIALSENDSEAAARHFEHALALEPANTDILAQTTQLFRSLGRLDEALAVAEYLLQHDPVNAFGHLRLGGAYARLEKYDDALNALRTGLRLNPTREQAHYGIGEVMLRKGDLNGALAEFQKESAESWRLDGLTLVHHALGHHAQSDAALAELISKYEKESSWNIAYLCAFRGEADRAFEWLDKAIDYKDTGLRDTAWSWEFSNIHSDPRWLPFLRKIGHAPEQVAAIKFDLKLPGK